MGVNCDYFLTSVAIESNQNIFCEDKESFVEIERSEMILKTCYVFCWSGILCFSIILHHFSVVVKGNDSFRDSGNKNAFLSAEFNEGECEEEELRNLHDLLDQCELFLAESTLDVDELGTFSGIDRNMDEDIGESEIYISIADMNGNTFEELTNEIWGEELDDAILAFDNLYGGQEYVPGLGSLATGYAGLVNAKYDFLNNRALSDSAGMHRSRNPGVGGFTNHYNVQFVTSQSILAGSEIFLNFGESWYATRAGRVGLPTATQDQYAMADNIVRQAFKDDISQKEWTSLRTRYLQSVTADANEIAVGHLLPRYIKDLEFANRVGIARYSHPHGSKGHVHSLPWLRNHGWCISYITWGISPIPDAGRGAFAKVHLPVNTVVAPAPMFVLDKRDMIMYEMYENTFGEINMDEENIVGTQLLLNYCYGHEKSNVLLLPMTSVVNLINHSPTPNVALRWTNVPGPHHNKDVLTMSEEHVLGLHHVRVMMEFVAIRDIQKGEEIVIDYGSGWSNAWNNHVKQWQMDQTHQEDDVQHYTSAHDFLEKFSNEKRPLPTRQQIEDPQSKYDPSMIIPQNLQFVCYYQHEERRNIRRKKKLRGNDTTNILTRKWKEEMRNDNLDCPMPCHLLSHSVTQKDDGTSDFSYRVELEDTLSMELHSIPDSCMLPDGRFVVTDIPSEFVTVVDLPYTSDQFIKGAFRHELGLPPGLFPQSWYTPLDN